MKLDAPTERSRRAAGLSRGLGPLDATMIVVGSMIGSGIFLTPAETTRLVGSPGWLLAAWVIAGIMTITGALSCAELAAMMPRAGGQYVFLREAYGPAVGFLFGWSLLLVVQTGQIAAVSVAFSNFGGVLAPWISANRYLVEPVRLGASRYALSLSTQQLVAVAMIAGPPALVTIATRSPAGRGQRTSARETSNSSSMVLARSTPH